MAKQKKSLKKKQTKTYKIDPDLYNLAMKKCMKETGQAEEKITLSGKINQWIYEWVHGK
jgi:hypothetical protein